MLHRGIGIDATIHCLLSRPFKTELGFSAH